MHLPFLTILELEDGIRLKDPSGLERASLSLTGFTIA